MAKTKRKTAPKRVARMTLTEKDHKTRSRGIGSSEIAMLLTDANGEPLSPWGGKHKLWRKKTGREPEQENKSWLKRGTFLEPAIVNWYADDNGVHVSKPPTKVHEKFPYVVDSVDGLVYEKEGDPHHIRTLEVKTAFWPKPGDWGDPGSDQVPEYYLVQCQWHEGVHPSRERVCDVPVLLRGERVDYRIRSDEELWHMLVMEAEKFWLDHVKADKAPPVDGTKATGEWFSRYLRQRTDDYLEAEGELLDKLIDYRRIRLSLAELGDNAQLLENQLKEAIGEDHAGVIVPGTKQKITWKETKGRKTEDWKSIARGGFKRLKAAKLITDVQIEQIVKEFTKETRGSRRWWPKALLDNEG